MSLPGLAPNNACTPLRCYRTPKTVTLDITRDSPFLHFLPYTVSHLCYDGRDHKHGGRARGGEETRWTLSRWWIKRLPCCANGTV